MGLQPSRERELAVQVGAAVGVGVVARAGGLVLGVGQVAVGEQDLLRG